MYENLFGRSMTVYKNNFLKLLLASIILGIVASIGDKLDGILGIAYLLISGPIAIGGINFFLGAYKSGTANLGNIFTYVTNGRKYFAALKLSIIVGISTIVMLFLSSILIALSVLGGIVVMFIVVVLVSIMMMYFGLTYYIFCTDDTIPAFRCIGLSFKYMGAGISSLIGLTFLFIIVPAALFGVSLLVPTFGIIVWGALLVLIYIPFGAVIIAGFYDSLIPANPNDNSYNNPSNDSQICNTPVESAAPVESANSETAE